MDAHKWACVCVCVCSFEIQNRIEQAGKWFDFRFCCTLQNNINKQEYGEIRIVVQVGITNKSISISFQCEWIHTYMQLHVVRNDASTKRFLVVSRESACRSIDVTTPTEYGHWLCHHITRHRDTATLANNTLCTILPIHILSYVPKMANN